jgi:hypothetical protein
MRVTMLRRYFDDTIIIEVWGGVLSLTTSSVMRSNSGSGDSCSDGGDCIWRCNMSNKTDHDTVAIISMILQWLGRIYPSNADRTFVMSNVSPEARNSPHIR